jgi:ketosteroid isomerase-like protein
MKTSVSRQRCAMLLLISSLAVWATVSIRNASALGKGITAPVCNPGTPIGDPADINAIKQLGRSMGDAMVAVDINKLNEIYADDWATVGSSGKVHTKQSLLDNVESGKSKLLWYELGPIDVQVVGDVAVAHGTVKERRINGFNGEVVYMDLLRKRAGKWVVVRSAGSTANAGN